MPKYKNKERDNALIEKALANTNNALSSWRDEMRVSMAEVLRLERSGWQPKPDRWTLAWEEASTAFNSFDTQPASPFETWKKAHRAAVEVLRKHFPEAERPAVVVPSSRAVAWATAARNLARLANPDPKSTACPFITTRIKP